MNLLTNAQAAKKLGISAMSLGRYIKARKIPSPRMLEAGGTSLYGWTEEEIERVRKLLPKIANGRKTRYQKLRAKNAPAGVPVPHKQESTKKKTQPRAAAPHKRSKPRKK